MKGGHSPLDGPLAVIYNDPSSTDYEGGGIIMSSKKTSDRGPRRPPKFEKPEEMQELIDRYFAECDAEGMPYTVPGVSLAVGMSSRQTLLEYEEKPAFSDTVKKAKLMFEHQRVKQLLTKEGSPTSMIFDLKANFGYRDRQEIDVNRSGPGSDLSMILE